MEAFPRVELPEADADARRELAAQQLRHGELVDVGSRFVAYMISRSVVPYGALRRVPRDVVAKRRAANRRARAARRVTRAHA